MRCSERLKVTRLLPWGVMAVMLGCALPRGVSTRHSDYTPPELVEPVTLSSENGVLEVSLFVRQGVATLNTVASPVHNFLLFGYEVQRGTASNGQRTGANLYPGPTLHVAPGDTLIVHVANELADLTIPDFYDPALTPKGGPVPLYPRQLTSAPFNLHTHGLHVSPKGNADNVLLNIPPGYTNTYTYRIPADHPEGMYWYHSHRHTVTAQQTYLGLAGLLSIGRSDGNIPIVSANAVPIRNMAIQYNFVFDRKGGQAVLNNYTWPQVLSTLTPPDGSALADGSYVPKSTPVNFRESAKGTPYFTVFWAGPRGPLSIDSRGRFEFLPSNLQSFTSASGRKIAAYPALPDHLRDLQFTINGQFEPVLRTRPGQTEIWVLANVSDIAYVPVTLTETATGTHPPIAIIGQDGNPFPEVHYPFTNNGTTLVIPPGSRYAIAVTMPSQGDLVVEMAPAAGIKPISEPGILYTNDGTDHPSAVLGTVEVEPAAISYFDGFFVSPTQVLARVKPQSGVGVTTAFVEGQGLGTNASFVDLQHITPAVERELVVSGGFKNEYVSNQDPKAFVYAFDDNTFPNTPLLQPRLGSVEQWSFLNDNNDEHPIHVHVNDVQVMQMVDPPRGTTTGVQRWSEDNANLPAPILGPHESVIAPGKLTLRSQFTEFTGPFVIHCHRLNHEDNGLMAFVNVIPAVSSFAVAASGSPGHAANVRIYDGSGGSPLATVTPFADFEGSLSATMGDVDGDQILDLVVGKGPGGTPEVAVYSGAGTDGPPFTVELLRFLAFDTSFAGGVSVAAAGIDGNELADNVIVGAGADIESQVKVFSSTRPSQRGAAPSIFASFSPYPGETTGVSVAAGLIDAGSGRFSIVTAPGSGSPARIKTFRFDLYRPNTGPSAWCAPSDPLPPGVPRLTADFLAFDGGYAGGASLSTGWIAGGAYGGAQSIVVAQDSAPGVVKIFSSGSALEGEPEIYLKSPDAHDAKVEFREISRFTPFADAPSTGVRVATTSTTSGADVLVSGLNAAGTRVRLRRYGMQRTSASARTLSPKLLDEMKSSAGIVPSCLGGG